mmetsp:Transcript_17210/g.26897  ORF Transcript_17210/g.26897 Transcript_17210/m.26897 type:complete len:213 (-) Transcript_17210:40-678(-)
MIELDKLWGRTKPTREKNRANFSKILNLTLNVVQAAAGAPNPVIAPLITKSVVAVLDLIESMNGDDVVINSTLNFELPGTEQQGEQSKHLHKGFYVVFSKGYDARILRLSKEGGLKLINADGSHFRQLDYIIVEVADYPLDNGLIELMDDETAQDFANKLRDEQGKLANLDIDQLRELINALGDRILNDPDDVEHNNVDDAPEMEEEEEEDA